MVLCWSVNEYIFDLFVYMNKPLSGIEILTTHSDFLSTWDFVVVIVVFFFFLLFTMWICEERERENNYKKTTYESVQTILWLNHLNSSFQSELSKALEWNSSKNNNKYNHWSFNYTCKWYCHETKLKQQQKNKEKTKHTEGRKNNTMSVK